MRHPGVDFWGNGPHQPSEDLTERQNTILVALQAALLNAAMADDEHPYIAFIFSGGAPVVSVDGKVDLHRIVKAIDEALP